LTTNSHSPSTRLRRPWPIAAILIGMARENVNRSASTTQLNNFAGLLRDTAGWMKLKHFIVARCDH